MFPRSYIYYGESIRHLSIRSGECIGVSPLTGNTYHYSINNKPINADYSALSEKIETNLKAPKFKVNDTIRITKYKNIFSKIYTENWSRDKYLLSTLFGKLILGLIKLKI